MTQTFTHEFVIVFQEEDLKWIEENIPASVADTYVLVVE